MTANSSTRWWCPLSAANPEQSERERERMERSRELRHSLIEAEFERLQVASAMREAARGHAC